MGCDIHFFAEKRADSESPWEFLPAPADGYDWELRDEIEKAGGTYECAHPYRFGNCDTTAEGFKPGYDNRYCDEDEPAYLRDWFDDRNYRLFGMLANVHNGSGFAGCDTGDAVEPMLPSTELSREVYGNQVHMIPHTRGWPEDCCPELKEEGERIEHTPSWLTVAEMQAYFDRKRKDMITVRGVVAGSVYEKLRDTGEHPEEWSGGISGDRILVVSPAIYEAIDQSKITLGDDRGLHGVESLIEADDLPEGLLQNERAKLDTARIFASARGEPKPEVNTKMRLFVRAEWQTPASEYTQRFEDCLAEMVEAAGVAPENIRAVFYFDS